MEGEGGTECTGGESMEDTPEDRIDKKKNQSRHYNTASVL